MASSLAWALCACAGRPTESGDPTQLPQGPTPLAQSTAVDLPTLCAEAGRSWGVLDDQGTRVATTRGSCQKLKTEYELRSQLRSEGQPTPDYEYFLYLDEKGRPTRAQLRLPLLHSSFVWEQRGLVEKRLGDQRVLREDAEQLWVIPDHAIYLRETMIRLGIGRDRGRLHHLTYNPSQEVLVELPVTLRRSDSKNAIEGRIGPAELELKADAPQLSQLRIEALRIGEHDRYRADSNPPTWRPELPEQPRPRYQLSEDLQVKPLKIPGRGEQPELAGEIVWSKNGSDEHKPRPGVLFISGVGPQDRYGFVPQTPVDVGTHALQDRLARAGFAVLRVDDRGVGESAAGGHATPGYDAYVEDSARALATLAAESMVDPRRLFVVGHAEGALTALLLAQDKVSGPKGKHRLAGAVLLAAPGRNLQEVIYSEIRRAPDRPGDREAAVAQAKEIHAAAVAGRDLPANFEAQRNWLVQIFAHDPAQLLRRLKIPVFAIQGGKDFQIDPEADFGAIAAILRERQDLGSRARLFPSLDHLLKFEAGESTPGHYADLRRRMAPEVLDEAALWLRQRAGLRNN